MRDVLSCLALAKEDNELPGMLQILGQADRLVVTETLTVDLTYQEDSDGWGKNFIAFVKE